MERATFVFVVTFACVAAAATSAAKGAFGYPDNDHVIITHYGPVRYKPVTAEQMNRPYGEGERVQTAAGRGYYRAEVIPLDMNTWMPLSGGGSSALDGNGARDDGAANDAAGEVMDVPMRVGYSVRPMPVRRRRNDYFLKLYPAARYHAQPSPPPLFRSSGGRLPAQMPRGFWGF